MPTNRKFIRIRKYLIYPKIQLGIAVYLGWFPILSLIGFYLLVSLFLKHELTELLTHAHITPDIAVSIITPITRVFFQAAIAMGLLHVAFMFIGSVLYTHRILGPIYRMVRVLQSRDFSKPIKFRKNDWLHELADAHNEAIKDQKKN